MHVLSVWWLRGEQCFASVFQHNSWPNPLSILSKYSWTWISPAEQSQRKSPDLRGWSQMYCHKSWMDTLSARWSYGTSLANLSLLFSPNKTMISLPLLSLNSPKFPYPSLWVASYFMEKTDAMGWILVHLLTPAPTFWNLFQLPCFPFLYNINCVPWS